MKVYRWLDRSWTFLGFVKMKGGGWRFGFGIGFIEWGKNTTRGIFLPRPKKS